MSAFSSSFRKTEAYLKALEDPTTRMLMLNEINEVEELQKAISLFSTSMLKKLILKHVEYGFVGWNEKENEEAIKLKLEEHYLRYKETGDKKQLVDIANLSMMLAMLRD